MSLIVMDTTLVQADWQALLRHMQRRIARDGWQGSFFAAWVAAIILGCAVLAVVLRGVGSEIEPLTIFLVALLCIGASAALQPWQRRQSQPDDRGTILGATRYELDANGVRTIRANNSSFVHWRAVQAVDETADHVFVIVDRISAIILPKRDLPPGAAATLEEWRRNPGAPLASGSEQITGPHHLAPVERAEPDLTPPTFWQAFVGNLKGGLQIAAFRGVAPDRFTVGFDQAGALALVSMATAFGIDWLLAGPNAAFNVYGLLGWASLVGVVLLVIFLIARAQSLRPDVLALLTPVLAVAPFAIALLSAIVMLGEWYLEDFAFQVACVAIGAIYLGLVLRAAYRPLDTATRVVAAISFLSVFFATDWFAYLGDKLWVPPYDTSEFVAERADSERILFQQAERIDAAAGKIAPAVAGEEEVFFVGFAGDGSQAVFGREALFAGQVFADRYASASRSLELINDDDDSESYPLATVSGLRYALRRVGERMNRDEDVVVLMLTSHGSSDGELSVSQSMMMLAQLDGQDVRNALDDAGIKWSVVIVSACYAGTFIEPLKSPRTLIITAADAEHNSFGCADDRDLTYFGEAFLRDALPSAASLPAAFEKARDLIRKREGDEGKTPSNPQLFVGEEMAGKLAALEAARAGE
jgi:hypothetical protein